MTKLLGVSLCAFVAPMAWSHGTDQQALPLADGLRWGVQAAVRAFDSTQTLPSLALPGYLVQGNTAPDPQGLSLEHGVAELGLRWAQDWGGYVALGRHGTDPVHAEAVWLQRSWVTDGQGRWTLRVGRQRPTLGDAQTRAGHFDDFALMPLAKQTLLNGDWIDDGAELGWAAPSLGDGALALHAGLWRGRVFPGGPRAAPVPNLHASLKWAAWSADASLARFEPQGRGARVQALGGGHSHATPNCDAVSAQVLCFTGRSALATAQLSWDPHPWPVSLTLATWARRDRGQLGSAQGLAAHSATVRGGWAQVTWSTDGPWSVGLRLEKVNASYHLQGSGARLLAQDAGLTAYAPARRVALMVGHRSDPRWQWNLEWGREQVGRTAHYLALRLRIHLEGLYYRETP